MMSDRSPAQSTANSAPRLLRVLVVALFLAAACGTDGDTENTESSAAVMESADDTVAAGSASEGSAPEVTEPELTEAEDAAPEDPAPEEAAAETAPEEAAQDAVAPATPTTPSTGLNVELFFDGAITEPVTTEDCTLSGGAVTTCYRITVSGDPVTYETGPFCPRTISDTAEAGGLWFDGVGVYDVDGAFIAGLAELYNDDNWRLYDENGNINVTETAEEFDLAARPNVDPSLQNHCVEGRLEWLTNASPVPTTVLIPAEPVLGDAPATTQGNLGVTLDGVVIAQSAPVDAILSAYTIAAFDDCGGHYNPVDGYHLHGAVGCSELDAVAEGETPMFAYAMDGIPVHSALADPASAGLDECNGHETAAAGYHYHANGAEQNLVIECLMGQTAATADGDGGGDGRPARGERPDGPPPGEGE